MAGLLLDRVNIKRQGVGMGATLGVRSCELDIYRTYGPCIPSLSLHLFFLLPSSVHYLINYHIHIAASITSNEDTHLEPEQSSLSTFCLITQLSLDKGQRVPDIPPTPPTRQLSSAPFELAPYL